MATFSNLLPQARADFDLCVASLAVPHRRKAATRALMAAGESALPALCRGLSHDHPKVRVGCCNVLDHFMDETAVPGLVENLGHPDWEVRARALHTLACDRCKEGACRPAEADVIPVALRLLRDDPHRRVRTSAADMLGQVAMRHANVREALAEAHANDPHPVVRKVAGWYIEGGPGLARLRRKAQKRL